MYSLCHKLDGVSLFVKMRDSFRVVSDLPARQQRMTDLLESDEKDARHALIQ